MKRLFELKDIRRLVNIYKSTVKPANKKDKANFSYPTFSIKGLQEVLEVCFFATLKREEGRFHNFSIVIGPIEENFEWDKIFDFKCKEFTFSSPIPFNVENITKLSTALDGTGNNIKVRFDDKNTSQIVGFDSNQFTSLKIQSLDIGKLLIWLNIANASVPTAIIDGKNLRFLGPSSKRISAHDLLNSVINELCQFDSFDDINIDSYLHGNYHDIAKMIRLHGHGGILIFVVDNNLWKKSIQQPIRFSPISKYAEIKEWIVRRNELWKKDKDTRLQFLEYSGSMNKVERYLKTLSQLTALDGATIVTRDFEVLAFGAKIKPINSKKTPNEIITLEPFEDSCEEFIKSFSGTRHQSAAQFIFDQRAAVAIVASQDGKLSLMFWDKEIEKVRVIQHAEYIFW